MLDGHTLECIHSEKEIEKGKMIEINIDDNTFSMSMYYCSLYYIYHHFLFFFLNTTQLNLWNTEITIKTL